MDLALGLRLMLVKIVAKIFTLGAKNWAFTFKLMQYLNKTTLIFSSPEQMHF